MIQVVPALSPRERAFCVQIRTLVFTVEQGVPPEREVDLYEGDCRHFLAYRNEQPVGTVRFRPLSFDTIKIERLAVTAPNRSSGVGQALMQTVLDEIERDPQITQVTLGAQASGAAFYTRFGFRPVGEEYPDGGRIPHRCMLLDFAPDAQR